MDHHPDRTACFSVTCTAAKQTQGLSYPTLPRRPLPGFCQTRFFFPSAITPEYRYACPHMRLIPVPV